jgi:hypothetical protein
MCHGNVAHRPVSLNGVPDPLGVRPIGRKNHAAIKAEGAHSRNQ